MAAPTGAPKLPLFPKLNTFGASALTDLNRWIQEMREYLLGAPYDPTLEVTFRAPETPTTKTDFTVQPIGVWPIALDRMDTAGPVSVALPPSFQWVWSAPDLSFPSLTGIAGTDTYRLRVAVRRGS